MGKLILAAILAAVVSSVQAVEFKTGDAAALREKSPAIVEFKTDLKPEQARKIIAEMSRKCYERGRMAVSSDGLTVETSMSGLWTGRTIWTLTDISPDGDGSAVKTYLPSDGPGFKLRAEFIQKWVNEGGRGCIGDPPPQ